MTPAPRLRPVLRAAVAVSSAVLLAACGGIADDAPSDADLTEFCDTFYTTEGTASEVASQLAEIGTPEDITEDERHGFETYVDGLDDEGDTPKSEVKEVQIPAEDEQDGMAFTVYAGEACASVAPAESPTDSTSEPTSEPTTEPTIEPTSEPTSEPTASES